MRGYLLSDDMDLHSASLQDGAEQLSSDVSGRPAVLRDFGAATRTPAYRACDIRLTLAARPENVAVVRRVVAALAESFALPPKIIEDVRLAVTEACTNIVRHAYRGEAGPMEVRVEPERGCLTVIVSDRGRGIQPNPDSEGPGLGLPLIATLSDSLEIEHSPARGSTLCMSFRADGGSVEAA